MLQKFLPDHFIRNYSLIADKKYIRLNGYTVFADLSGFTAMSEKLSVKGLEGAEEISRILNSIFECIISVFQQFGGSVYKFGGDAVTVFYPEEKSGTDLVLISVLKVMREMGRYRNIETIAGRFSIEIKIGVAYGQVVIGQVGSEQLDYFIAGEALDQACLCEHHAEKGTIVVNDTFYQMSNCRLYTQHGGVYWLLDQTAAQEECFFSAGGLPVMPNRDDSLAEINNFARSILVDRDKTGEMEKGELRSCAIVFLSFGGITYDENFDYGLLNSFYILTADLVNKYGGFINKIDMGDKGSKIIILFGAPFARENNEELALRCVEQIRKKMPAGLSVQIGINSGGIYFGVIGAENRQEFTVIGSVVNLSARLMSAAGKNEILISAAVRNRFGGCECSDAKMLDLKGVRDPYESYLFYQTAQKSGAGYIPLIGRLAEQSDYREILTLNLNLVKIVIIKAEAGLGKSVLCSKFQELAAVRYRTAAAGCLSYTQTTPYFVISRLIEQFWQFDDQTDYSVKISKLKEVLKELGYSAYLDSFATFLDWQTDESRRTGDEALKELFRGILLEIFRLEMVCNQQAVFLEDLHWADQASIDFLQELVLYLADSTYLLHLVYRPDEQLSVLEKNPGVRIFELQNLDSSAAKAFLLQKFALSEIPADLFNEVFNKTAGNPFYMEEIFIALRNEGWFSAADSLNDTQLRYKIKAGSKDISIPGSLNEIILSRIDKLDAKSKQLLKIASVVGRSFHFNVLLELQDLENLLKQMDIRANLKNLTEVEMTFNDRLAEQQYFFKHVITQEVAYGTILFSLKRKYHADIAVIYERNNGLTNRDVTELLAFHYQLSGLMEKTRFYLLQSAQKAMHKFAWREAEGYLAKYKKTRPAKNDLTEARFLEVEICRMLEKRRQGILICKNIRKQYQPTDSYYQKAVAKESDLLRRSGLFVQAIDLVDGQSGYCTLSLELECRLNRAICLLISGQSERFEEELSFLRDNKSCIVTEPLLWCRVTELDGYYHLQLRELETARRMYEESLATARKNHLKTQEFAALMSIATCYAQAGDPFKARDIYTAVCREAKKISNFELFLNSLNNLAKTAYATGEFETAEKQIREGLKLAARYKKEDLKDRLLETQASILLEKGSAPGKAATRLKIYHKVLKICQTRIDLAEKRGNQIALLYIRDIQADVYFRMDKFSDALELYNINLQKALQLKEHERIGHTYGNLANCYAELGNYLKAIDFYQKQLAYARKYHDLQSEGKALFNIGYTWKNNLIDAKRAKKFFLEAEEIFQEIGYTGGLQAVRAQMEN